ncbi:uncharacterized protein BJX67DRAFT_50307 [Aspergillus lucknowensis]|uniref:Myb-like domain-containing protein n=1 Tax=Aspergillus lucknowensis TaxID=176173 RepID=A0ABR4LUM1_9EURO
MAISSSSTQSLALFKLFAPPQPYSRFKISTAQLTMPMSWTSEAEARLLLGVLAQFKGTKLDYKALAAFMGPGCTVPAIKQHICKLRREAATAGPSLEKSAGVLSPPLSDSSPKKTKRARSLETPIKGVKSTACISDDAGGYEVDGKHGKLVKEEDETKMSFLLSTSQTDWK